MHILLVSVLLVISNLMHGMSEQDAAKKVFEIARLYESEVTADHIDELERVLPYVSDISRQRRCIRNFEYADTFLATAAIRSITCCRILVEHKADMSATDQWGNTPFDMARKFSCSNTMLFFLEVGADNFQRGPKDMNFWTEEEEEHFYQVLETHRKKIVRELELFLSRDTAGIVSKYVV